MGSVVHEMFFNFGMCLREIWFHSAVVVVKVFKLWIITAVQFYTVMLSSVTLDCKIKLFLKSWNGMPCFMYCALSSQFVGLI